MKNSHDIGVAGSLALVPWTVTLRLSGVTLASRDTWRRFGDISVQESKTRRMASWSSSSGNRARSFVKSWLSIAERAELASDSADLTRPVGPDAHAVRQVRPATRANTTPAALTCCLFISVVVVVDED